MSGIHHVTAIAGGAERNLAFYTGVLGLRLVKKTVNFDDPSTYHLYYGDEQGQPGTILTFFPWQHAAAGQLGVGETQETAFRIPKAALGFWMHRFIDRSVPHAREERFGETLVTFRDPDGMRFALVAVAGAETESGWASGDIPAEHAIRGFHGVTLLVNKAAPTAAILTDVLGFREVAQDGALTRYRGDAPLGGFVDLREAGDFPRGRAGRGSVHHIAFRAAERCRAGRDGAAADRQSSHASDRAEGSQLFPLDLFPRAERHPVRDRDRRSGFRGRRAGERPWPRAQAAAVPRTAPRRDRGQAAAPVRGGMMTGNVSVVAAGAPFTAARAAVILLHGRGASAEDILGLADEFGQSDIAYLAPQAPNSTWYPYSFLAPLEQNEPHLTRALGTIAALLERLAQDGFGAERVGLVGFSQGGCLTLEYVARNAKRYGAVAGLSAGLIGPPGTRRDYAGSLAGTPVFLGCSDVDGHIPLARVNESRDVLTRMGAAVTERIYPGMGHTINADEIAAVTRLLAGIEAVP